MISFLLLISSLVVLNDGCTTITLTSDADFLNGEYTMDPSIIADGRPVYVQPSKDDPNSPKMLFHYSHTAADETVDIKEVDFIGRWMIGSSLFSPNGWAYMNSWSISPETNMLTDLSRVAVPNNPSDEIGVPKWNVWDSSKTEWNYLAEVSITCKDSSNVEDWLFITTPSLMWGDASLNHRNTHGFYYQIADDYWRQVDENVFLHRSKDVDTTKWTLFVDNGYTDVQGIPKQENLFTTLVATTKESSVAGADLSDAVWALDPEPASKDQVSTISLAVINREESGSIYAAQRAYYRVLKDASFVDSAPSEQAYTELNNGFTLPMIGLGTGGLSGYEENRATIETALSLGYKLIDSASAYHSEQPIGDILYESETVKRDELFLVSKVWPTDLGFVQTYDSFTHSLQNMGVNYLDLYMLHWPECFGQFSWMDCSQASGRPWQQSYQVIEKLYSEGYILSIGVSNFDFNRLQGVFNSPSVTIIPQVVQNYFDVTHQDFELQALLQTDYNIMFQGYATYRGIAEAERRQRTEPQYAQWKTFLEKMVAIRNEKDSVTISTAQLLLRWLVGRNIAVIPRSNKEEKLRQNIDLWSFEFSEAEDDRLYQASLSNLKTEL